MNAFIRADLVVELTAKSKKSKKFCAVIGGWAAYVRERLAVGRAGVFNH
jgi:hypothetical protein